MLDLIIKNGKCYIDGELKDVDVAIKDGKIEGFEGDNETIKNVEKHYHKITKMFNISKNIVDSWHAGIHPGTYYNKPIEENPDRLSNTIFGSPKYLHLHTCVDYPPGEI